jgi:hypothetical protein
LFRPEFWALGKHVAASTLFAENFLLWSESGYFDVASDHKPLLHLWSLAIEEQFYIFWPIVLSLAWRNNLSALKTLSVLGICSFALNVFDTQVDPTSAYYSPFGRVWELMIGGALAHIQLHRPQALAKHKQMQSILGMTIIILALIVVSEKRSYPGFWGLLPTIGAFLVISGGKESWINRQVLSSRPFVSCGLISYPLYLWHWPLFSYFFMLGSPSIAKMTVLILIALFLSTLTFLFIEKPFRYGVPYARKPLSLIASMMLVLVTGSTVFFAQLDPRLYKIDAPTKTEWDFLKSVSKTFVPNGTGVYEFEADREKLAIFIGDSEIAQYAERIHAMVEAQPARLGTILAVGGGCVPIGNVFTSQVRFQDCWNLRARAFERAKDARIARVVIGANWSYYFLDGQYEYRAGGSASSLTSQNGKTAALDQLEREIRSFASAGKSVFLLLGNPRSPKFNPFSAANRVVGTSEAFTLRTADVDPREAALRLELLALAQRTGAVAIDPVPRLCDSGKCRASSEDGIPIFKDNVHFNPKWALANASFVDVATAP